MLDGIRVVDLSQNLAGPHCTQILADLGADVVKVEPPSGDAARSWGPPFWNGEATLFLAANRNKRSIAIDLKTRGGREVLKRLVGSADVFVQAFRTGVIDSLGFGHEKLRAERPELIYAAITGFGSEGPQGKAPGYDPLMQAYCGMMSMTGFPEGRPARVAGSVIDIGTGMLTALGIVAALRERDHSGVGKYIESSLLATSLGYISYHITGYLATGEIPGRMGTGVSLLFPYEAFPTQDGELMISGGNDGIFQRLCEALGLGEVAADSRFKTNPSRIAHQDVLRPILAARTAEFSSAELRAVLEEHRVPCSPIQNVREVAEDPQVKAEGLFDACPHPRIPDYRQVSFPLKFDGERPPVRRAAPLKGQHTGELLRELGYDSSETEALLEQGSVVAAEAAA